MSDLNKLRTSFANVRKELGLDYDIMVHCHNEYDLATAKAMARAVEEIQPKWFEDPLPPQFSDSWVALKRDCRVPLLTGEKRYHEDRRKASTHSSKSRLSTTSIRTSLSVAASRPS